MLYSFAIVWIYRLLIWILSPLYKSEEQFKVRALLCIHVHVVRFIDM